MHTKLIVIFLVGLAASTYALDLSHADKRSAETEPRLFGFLNDFYAQVVYPPANHIVTSLALLGAQVLAGVSQTGLPAPHGRMSGLSDIQIHNILDDLWKNAVRPHIEKALSGFSLLASQLLAGINLGRQDLTEAEMRGFVEALNQAVNSVFTNVIQKPLEDAISGGALMLAQVLAGLGTNGVNLSSLFGKRDLDEAEMRGFGDALTQAFNSVFTNVIQKPLEDALSGGALMLAQVMAGLGTNGVNLSNLFGKRDLSEIAGRQDELRGFFDTLGQNLLNGLQSVWSNVIKDPLEQAISGGALMAAQVLAGLGTNGVNLGKRELEAEGRGQILNGLVGHANGIYENQIKPILQNALNDVTAHLAGVLSNLSQSLGRR